MSTDIHIADITVHLHPHITGDDMEKVEQTLRAQEGVVSIHFDAQDHPHALIVAYNPDEVTSMDLLSEIRRYDNRAMMSGM